MQSTEPNYLAGMIVQEGRSAALEIAETVGVEAALDAMAFIADSRQAEMVRYREALEEIEDDLANWSPDNKGGIAHALQLVRSALSSPSSDLTKED